MESDNNIQFVEAAGVPETEADQSSYHSNQISLTEIVILPHITQ